MTEIIDAKPKVQQTISFVKVAGRDPPLEDKINDGNESDDETSDISNDIEDEMCHDVDDSNSL